MVTDTRSSGYRAWAHTALLMGAFQIPRATFTAANAPPYIQHTHHCPFQCTNCKEKISWYCSHFQPFSTDFLQIVSILLLLLLLSFESSLIQRVVPVSIWFKCSHDCCSWPFFNGTQKLHHVELVHERERESRLLHETGRIFWIIPTKAVLIYWYIWDAHFMLPAYSFAAIVIIMQYYGFCLIYYFLFVIPFVFVCWARVRGMGM